MFYFSFISCVRESRFIFNVLSLYEPYNNSETLKRFFQGFISFLFHMIEQLK